MRELEGKTVMVLGDSIMNGSGNFNVGVGEYLVVGQRVKLIKYCRGGARVGYHEGKNWVIPQVQTAIEKGDKPDYIVFDGFTNDCNMTDGVHADVPLGEITEGFEGFDINNIDKEKATFSYCFECILCAIKKHFSTAKVLFVRPHKMGRREAQIQIDYGERAVELCKKWGIAVADIYKETDLDTFLPEHRDKYTFDSYNWGRGDCTHPNALCYEEIYMPLILDKLKKL